MTDTTSVPWHEDDMLALRAFFDTQAGKRMVGKTLESVPPLLPGGESNAILIRSGEVRGWSEAMRTLISLAAPPPVLPNTPPAYPPLDDDRQWPS